MYRIWVRIGDYAIPAPLTTYNKMSLTKNDPVIRESLRLYREYLENQDVELKEPIRVVVREVVGWERIGVEKRFDFKITDIGGVK